MIVDYNLKAVIFDDKIEEAQPIIDALNYERIPNIFINFKDDTRDDKKLKNIRIIFADLIVGGESEGSPEKVLESIRASILDNIEISNGPFILVVWSKHSSRANELEERIKEKKNLKFVTLSLDKNKYFEKKSGNYKLQDGYSLENLYSIIDSSINQIDKFDYVKESEIEFKNKKSYDDLLNDISSDIKKDIKDIFEVTENTWQLKDNISFQDISKDILEQLVQVEYLNIFLEWESDARDTISKVLTSLLENISIKKDVEDVVSSAIKTTLGQRIASNSKDKLNAFYHTLNSILADSIENNTIPECKHNTFLNSLDLDNIDSNMKSIINSKTLFEDPNGSRELKNGNIYCFNDYRNIFYGDVIKDTFGSDIKNIFKEEFYLYKKDVAKILYGAIPTNENDKKAYEKKCFDDHSKYIHPILFEFTPSCDIAQVKYKKSRLIFGYLVDSKYDFLEKKSESLYKTKFHFKYKNEKKGLDSNFLLVFSIKYIFAVSPNKVREIVPLIRARKELTSDLQQSIASHISRIGISSLDGFN